MTYPPPLVSLGGLEGATLTAAQALARAAGVLPDIVLDGVCGVVTLPTGDGRMLTVRVTVSE